MNTALITAIGSFSADIVIKTLKKNNFCTIGTDINEPELIVDSQSVDHFYQVPKVSCEESYLDMILSICHNHHVSHILPLTDLEVDFYNKYRSEFVNRGILVCISPENSLKICRNKKLQFDLIKKKCTWINPIPSVYADSIWMPPYPFPIIAKPFDGRSSIGLLTIHDFTDWEYFVKKNNNGKYILQPFIEGHVVTVDVVRDHTGDRCVAIPRLELLRTQNGAGTSVKVFTDPILECKCFQLANELGVIGCVNFEYIIDESGQYHYVECNPRFSGGVEFSCIAGYDCVMNHIKSFEGERIDDLDSIEPLYIARKYEEYVMQISDT